MWTKSIEHFSRIPVGKRVLAVVIGICWILLIALEVYLLTLDHSLLYRFRSRTPVDSPAVAEVISTDNVVRVQNPDELLWENVASEQTLYQQQSLITLAASSAKLRFLGGGELYVAENSLIRLDYTPRSGSAQKNHLVIRLQRGALQQKVSAQANTESVELQFGQKRVALDPGAEFVATATDDGESASLSLLKGKARIQDGGQEMIVEQGDQVQIAAGRLERTHHTVLLLEPHVGAVFPGGEKTFIPFSWMNLDPRHEEFRLEFSPDPDFAKDVEKFTAGRKSKQFSFPGTDHDVTWHWRAVAADGSPLSEVHRFVIRKQEVPQPLHPADGMVVMQPNTLDLVWSAADTGKNFELQVRPESGEPQTIVTREPLQTIRDLASGEYEWRVRVQPTESVVTAWSDSRKFRIAKPKAAPPPDKFFEPQIIRKTPQEPQTALPPAPATGFLASVWQSLRLITTAHAQESTPDETWIIRLAWEPVAQATAYRIQIARDEDFKEILIDTQVEGPRYDWSFRKGMENEKGRVHYRVASINTIGLRGDYADGRIVQIPETIIGTKAIVAQAAADAAADAEKARRAAEREAKRKARQARKRKAAAKKRRQEAEAEAAARIAAAGPPPGPSLWTGSAEFLAGYGDLSQSSGADDLSSVKMKSPYMRQDLAVDVSHFQKHGTNASVRLRLSLQKFDQPEEVERRTAQGEVSVFAGRIEYIRWGLLPDVPMWQFGWGMVLDRDFRFQKAGKQTVTPEAGISLGVGGYVMRKYRGRESSMLQVVDAGAALIAPVTGVLHSGHLAIEGNAWAEWNIWRISGSPESGFYNWLGLKLSAGMRYSRWSDPEGTSVTNWSVALAPTIHFHDFFL